jgi:hypothetical protein
MRCAQILGNLGFECESIGAHTLRVWSPFTYAGDGEHIAVYVEEGEGEYRVTDNAEAALHVASRGVNLKNRLHVVRKIAGNDVTVSDGGEITSTSAPTNVAAAVTGVINTAMSIGHLGTVWAPRQKSVDFTKRVGEVLVAKLGESRIEKNVTLAGASGHQIEIPFVVQADLPIYVQPVAYGDHRVNWDNVYRGLGKMIDLKNAGAADSSRVVVLEDVSSAPGDEDIASATALLSITASVVRFSKLNTWANRI